MRPTPLPALLLVLAASAGCSRHATEPASAPLPASAVLIATQPPARATGVLYDSDIWGQFDRNLDPLTVTPESAFLKLDGQRIPCDVGYDPLTQRVILRPQSVLQLQRTYTAEFTPAIHSASGVPLPPNVFFQFTTNSLRRVSYDYPSPGALEGPVATLGWGGTQGPVNEVFFEVYASEDSLAVEQRTAPWLQRAVFTRFLPSLAWRRGARIYWALTSEHLITHERIHGPVTSFQVVDATVPEQTIELNVRDHGSIDTRQRVPQFCGQSTLPCGPFHNAAIHWSYGDLPAGARVVGATASLVALDAFFDTFSRTQPTLWLSQNDWSQCQVSTPGPPFPELNGLLANSVPVGPVRVEFTSDRLAAFVEAQFRGRTLTYGTLVRALDNTSYHSGSAGDANNRPHLLVRYVLPSPQSAP